MRNKMVLFLLLSVLLLVTCSTAPADQDLFSHHEELADLAPQFSENQPVFQFHQIDVGFANAYLIQCGNIAFMVDCGWNDGKNWPVVEDYLHKAGVEHLDAFFCSHFHADHVGNIQPLMAEFGRPDTPVYGPADELLAEWQPLPNGVYRRLWPGEIVRLGDIEITCVGPVGELDALGWANRDSLNLVIRYGQRRFMVTGDFVRGKEVTENFRDVVAGVDVFQFPHHGKHPYCVDPWAVQILAPTYIVVPAAVSFDCRYHFSFQFHIPAVWVDSGSGNIVFLTDGERLELHTFAEPGAYAGL